MNACTRKPNAFCNKFARQKHIWILSGGGFRVLGGLFWRHIHSNHNRFVPFFNSCAFIHVFVCMCAVCCEFLWRFAQ